MSATRSLSQIKSDLSWHVNSRTADSVQLYHPWLPCMLVGMNSSSDAGCKTGRKYAGENAKATNNLQQFAA
eukprot:6192872-Pleurochrysis_carterae.AAC.6